MAPPGEHSELCRAASVPSIRIRNVQGTVEPAVLVARIDYVVSFGGASITFALLRCKSTSAQSHFVGANHSASCQKFHQTFLLEHQDRVDMP